MPSLFDMDIQKLKAWGKSAPPCTGSWGPPPWGTCCGCTPGPMRTGASPPPIRDTVLQEVAVVRPPCCANQRNTGCGAGSCCTRPPSPTGRRTCPSPSSTTGYIPTLLKEGETYLFRGKVAGTFLRREMLSPEFLPEGKALAVVPIYPATQGLTSRMISAAMQNALKLLPETVNDPLPHRLREQYQLCHLGFALEHIHFPQSAEGLETARRRLIFEEFLLLQLGLMGIKKGRRTKNPHPIPNEYPSGFEKLLPFALTGAQKRAIAQGVADMAGDAPMNRLIQGDVGSGKTAVAAALCWAVIQSGAPGRPDGPPRRSWPPSTTSPSPGCWSPPHHRGTAHRVGKGGGEEKDLRGAGRRPHPSWSSAPTPSSGTRWSSRTMGLVITDEQHRFGGGAALGIGPEGHLSPPAGDERHPHPPYPGADGVRRPGHLHSGRAAPGPAEDRDLPH